MTLNHANVEMIPGTEIINYDASAKQTLVPVPSSDPRDPLNWGRKWKFMVMASQWLFTWIAVTGELSIAQMFPLLGKEYHLNDSQLALLTGIIVITLGFANFIIVPMSNIFGHRAISLVFSVLITLTCIWQALATSQKSLLAARAVNGLVCATSESIPVQMIADVFFLHNTGYFMGAFLGPIMAGSIAALHGWQSFFWLETALSALSILLIALTFPETKFHRGATVVQNTTTTLDGSEIVNTNEQSQLEKHTTHTAARDSEMSSLETPTPSNGRPSRAQFNPFERPDPKWKAFVVRDTWTPIKVFFNPIILWAGLMLAGPADMLLFFNITESPVLAAPPYFFKPDQVGYTNFAFAVGAIIGLATAGPYSDWVAARAARKNGGIREAEMRLPALWIYMIITILSVVLGSVAYQQQWAWGNIVVWGYGLSGLSVTTVPTICIAYAIDCYKPISGEIMVVATVCKNTIAFSYSYWVFDLAHESKNGWITPAMVIFACTIGPAFFGIPLYFGLGKRIRKWTKNSDVHRMEAMI
ncbi:Transmembrane transporter [Pyrenophora tritici-repentis]|nr:Transmembrane transporter [Pyrenophora tritici-repentis]